MRFTFLFLIFLAPAVGAAPFSHPCDPYVHSKDTRQTQGNYNTGFFATYFTLKTGKIISSTADEFYKRIERELKVFSMQEGICPAIQDTVALQKFNDVFFAKCNAACAGDVPAGQVMSQGAVGVTVQSECQTVCRTNFRNNQIYSEGVQTGLGVCAGKTPKVHQAGFLSSYVDLAQNKIISEVNRPYFEGIHQQLKNEFQVLPTAQDTSALRKWISGYVSMCSDACQVGVPQSGAWARTDPALGQCRGICNSVFRTNMVYAEGIDAAFAICAKKSEPKIQRVKFGKPNPGSKALDPEGVQ